MRKSILFIGLTVLGAICLAALIGLHPIVAGHKASRRIAQSRSLVGRLGLTDICMFTEATYTRHPNLADRHVPFQDHPMAISLFPSESLLGPPPHLVKAASATVKGYSP